MSTKIISNTARAALTLVCAACLFAAVGCDGDKKSEESEAKTKADAGDAKAKAKGEAAAGDAGLIAKDQVAGGDACERLFNAKMVGEAVGADLSSYESKSPMKGTCSLGTGGTDYRFSLVVTAFETVDLAKQRFEMTTQSFTAEDSAAAMKAVEEQAAKQDPTLPEQAKPITDVIKNGGPSSEFVDVPSIGDQARMETQSFTRGDEVEKSAVMHGRVRNLHFIISASKKGGDLESEETMSTALAKAVAAKLAAM